MVFLLKTTPTWLGLKAGTVPSSMKTTLGYAGYGLWQVSKTDLWGMEAAAAAAAAAAPAPAATTPTFVSHPLTGRTAAAAAVCRT